MRIKNALSLSIINNIKIEMKKLQIMRMIFMVCGFTSAIAQVEASSLFKEVEQSAESNNEQKRAADSRQELLQALRLAQEPNEKSSILLKIGQTYQNEKKYVSSRQAWQEVLTLKGVPSEDTIAARYAIGGSFLEEKQFQAARDAWQPVIEDALVLPQTRITFQMAVATSFGAESKWPQAREALQKVIKNPATDLSTRAIAQQLLGDTYFSTQQWKEALDEFRSVTELSGLTPTLVASAQSRLIQTYRAMGDQGRADEEFKRFESAQVLLASEAIKQKQYAQARQNFTAVLVLQNSRRSFALALQEKIGETYLAEGNSVKGRSTLKQVVETSPYNLPLDEVAAFRAVQQNAQLRILESYVNEKKQEEADAAFQFLLQMPELLAPLRSRAEQKIAELK